MPLTSLALKTSTTLLTGTGLVTSGPVALLDYGLGQSDSLAATKSGSTSYSRPLSDTGLAQSDTATATLTTTTTSAPAVTILGTSHGLRLYSALIVERRVRVTSMNPSYEPLTPTIRIPIVTEVKTTQETPGGYQEGEFVIPARYVRWEAERLNRATVWIMDGTSVAFYGHVVKPTPRADGGIIVTCDGAWRRGDDTRMREVWGDGDLSTLAPAHGNAGSASMSINADGFLVLAFPKDHSFAAGSYVAADYFLFGEQIGLRDGKKVNGWRINIGGASTYTSSSNLECRIYGLSTPGDTSPNLLQAMATGGSRTEISDASHGGDNINAWAIPTGHRCIRVGLYNTAATNAFAEDKTLIITSFRVSTRATSLGMNAPSTTDIAKDVWASAGNNGYELSTRLLEEHTATTGGMVTGNINDSGKKADGVSFQAWTPPREILESLAQLDGYKVGLWKPSRRPDSSAHVVASGSSKNYWPSQPAELVYEAWRALGDPDYIIRLARGATWEPSGEAQRLSSAQYVNYTSNRGRTLSLYYEDATAENRLYEQGEHVAEDWTIDPSVSTVTATTLAAQNAALARQPALTGTITIYGDRPGSIMLPSGGRPPKLSVVKPCIIRVVDAKGPKAGRVERVEYTAATSSESERLVLTLNDPASGKLQRRLNRIAAKDARHRSR